MDEELLDILSRRSNPGIIILNNEGRLVFINNEALDMIGNPSAILENLKDIGQELQTHKNISEIKNRPLIFKHLEKTFSARAFPIGVSEKGKMTHLLFLLERLTEKREINFEKVRSKYKLTKKEIEIVKLLSQGYSNKDIAQSLCISEYTVKDHIKKIMEKMDCSSRGEIIALLK
jgi:DNA-binding CsgD family transcriptional regulator